MPRNVTVTFEDGTSHVYQNAPDDITPAQVEARAAKEFSRRVVGLNGGRGEAAPAPERTFGDTAKDIGITALKGAIGLPQAFAGLADIPTGGRVSKALEGAGLRFSEAQKALEEAYSPAQKEAMRRVGAAQGFLPTVKEAIVNPSVPLAAIGESLPQMLGGAGIARGLIAKGVPAIAAVGAGEGALGAGSAAAQMRAESPEGLLTPKQSAAALGLGAGTAVLGAAGAKFAKSIGLADVDTLIAKGGAEAAQAANAKMGFMKSVVGSGLAEGAFEEMPQSAQEQMWQNWAGDKPIFSGVPEAAGMGLVTGAIMGGTAGGVTVMGKPEAPKETEFDKRRKEMESAAPAAQYFDQASPLENPYGNIPADLMPDVTEEINAARSKRKQAPLDSFSIEDAVNAGIPQERVDTLLSGTLEKAGLFPDQEVAPQDVLDAAADRGVNPDQPGFKDFLRRATGSEDLDQMSPVQRVAAFGAIQNLPEGVDTLPTGTNARSFTEGQYKSSLKAIRSSISGGASRDSLLASIQKAGIKNPQDAQSILQNAIREGQVGAISTPAYAVFDDYGKVVRTYDDRGLADQAADRLNGSVTEVSQTSYVPPGQTEIPSGEATGYQIRVGDSVLASAKTPEEIDQKADRLGQIRERIAASRQSKVDQLRQQALRNTESLEELEARGLSETTEYAKKQKQIATDNAKIDQQIGQLTKEVEDAARPMFVSAIRPKVKRAAKAAPVKPAAKPAETPELSSLRQKLLPALRRFGLEGVGLRVVKSIEDGGAGADGAYANRLIQIAMSAENPMGVMRHEVIHALKELGAFKPREWRALEKRAKSEWVDKFIRQPGLYERYQQVYQEQAGSLEGFDEYIAEEAIAEAFKYFDQTKPPVGLIGNLFNRLRNFFASLRNAMQGAGFQTAEDVLGRIEEGKVTPAQAEAPAAAPKFSVAPETDEQFFIRQQNKPDAKQVVFEIAPNPDDADLSGEWNSLSVDQRKNISGKIKNKLTKSVLDSIGARGRITEQVGSYLNDTNASFALYLEKGDAITVAKSLGFVFSQQSMMAVSPSKAKGMTEYGAVTIDIGDKNFDQIQDIYNTLRQMDINGQSPVGGQTTSNGMMTILNDPEESGVSNEELADYIDAALGYKYNVLTENVFASFPSAKDYDYASPQNDPAGKAGDIRKRLRSIRDEASETIRREIDAARGQPEAGAKAGEAKRVTTDTIVIDGVIRSTRNGNGRLIHPTEEGVRNFWKWFGDAVTVDRRGRPVVMYHGTSRDITEFRPQQANAIFVTKNPNFAEDFTSMSEGYMRKEFFDGMTPDQRYDMIMGAAQKYLTNKYITKADYNKIKKDYKGLYFNYEKIPTELETEVDERISNALPSRANILPLYVAAKNPFDYENPKHVDKLINTIESGGGYVDDVEIKNIKLGRWAAIEENHIQKALIDSRCDGFFISEGGEKNLAVYDRRQIKSAVGNVGEFSPKSKDIRYSIAPPIAGTDIQESLDGYLNPNDEALREDYIYNNKGMVKWMNAAERDEAYQDALQQNLKRLGFPDEFIAYRGHPLDRPSPATYANVTTNRGYADNFKKAYVNFPKGSKWVVDELKIRRDDVVALGAVDENELIVRLRDDALVKVNVTPEQDIRYSIAQTKTPEFKRWFGDSKVVDADGKPLVVYHGTNKDISEFATRQKVPRNRFYAGELGSWFGSDPGVANTFSTGRYAESGAIYPVYLSIKNPREFESYNEFLDFAEGRKSASSVRAELEKEGHDGIVVRNSVTDLSAMRDDWVAFRPDQIKSAIGNRGTFDPNNPDIRYSFRNDIKSKLGQGALSAIERTTSARQGNAAQKFASAISPDSFTKIRQRSVNKYESIERNSKTIADRFGESRLYADYSAIGAALFSDRAAGIAAESFKNGVPVYANGFTKVDDLGGKVKGLLPILKPLMKYNDPFVFQAFQFYGATRRGARLMVEGREKLLTPQDIRFGKQLEQTYPEFKTVFDEYQKYNRGIVKFLVDTGVLSEEMGKKWMMYADYIPFYRQADGEETFGPKIFHNLSGVQPTKRLKGGEFKLDDFIETVVRNTRSAVEQGMKNVAAQRAVRDAVDLNSPGKNDYAKRMPPGTAGAPDIVTVREKGKDAQYRLADPLLYEALKGLNLKNPYEDILRIVGFPTRLLRELVTKMPDFMLTNLFRDSAGAWTTSGTKFTPIIDTFVEAGKTLVGMSPEAKALKAAGIGTGYEFSGDIKAGAKQFAKELRKVSGKRTAVETALLPITKVWDTLDAGSNASDLATRAVIYKRTMEETGNEAEAALRALEVMNFGRMGSSQIYQVFSAIVPFFGARVQGLDLLYRAGTGRLAQANRDAAHKAFKIRALTLFALSIAYWMLASDTDEYKKANEETRDNYWIIGPVRVPIPFEIGVLFKVIPERMMGYLFGTDTGKDVKKSAVRNIISTLSMNPVPQGILPILEANVTDSGYSSFTGRGIIPRGMEDVAPQFQETSTTSTLAKKLGKELGVSPIKIDHVIQGYFGSFGTYMAMGIDSMLRTVSDPVKPAMGIEQTPIIKRFYASPLAGGTKEAFFDLKDRVDEVVRTQKFLMESGRYEDLAAYMKENGKLIDAKSWVSRTDKELKNVRELIRATSNLTERDITPEEKREALNSLRRSENYLTEQSRILKKSLMP